MKYQLSDALMLSRKNKLQAGDNILFTLKSGEKIKAEVIGLKHDNLANGKKANTTIRFTIDGEFNMNEDWTNVGGWKKSKMRTKYCKRLFNLLPDELQKAVKTVLKATTKGGGSDEIEITKDKIFLLSLAEATNETRYGAGVKEGEQYELFRKKGYKFNKWSWLRSPGTSSTSYFWCVVTTGYNGYYYAGSTYGVCFALCI